MRLFAASVVLGWAVAQGSAWGQDAASAKMAESVIREWPAGLVTTENKPGEWAYEEGVLLDGMTILNVPYVEQNLIKSVILLVAIVIDSFVNPRDEQTAQQEQGDI